MGRLGVLLLITQLSHGAVLDKEAHLSSSGRMLRGRPLSEAAHKHEAGDYDYDHESFLGDELSTQFDSLSPEESQRRLMIIVSRIDTDGDGFVTEEELKVWIKGIQEQEVSRDTERMWKEKVGQDKDTISWEQYRNVTFGFLDSTETFFPSGYNFSNLVGRDLRRFTMADRDGNKELNKEEFQAFVHPEDAGYMRDAVVMETMEDMDKDKDGRVSAEEYIADLWQGRVEEEPDWVRDEREQFRLHRDKDKDGFLSFEEVKDWIVPEDFDLTGAEAHHLIVTVDIDQDDKLTKDEILDRYDVFVGSQATHFGELLNRHDEF